MARASSPNMYFGSRTDVGCQRERNEDSLVVSPPLFAVADGMGGHEGGDVASRIAVEELGRLAEEGYDPRQGPAAVAAAIAEPGVSLVHIPLQIFGA